MITPIFSAWFFLDEAESPVGPYLSEDIAAEQQIYYGKYLTGTLTEEDKAHCKKVEQSHIDLFQTLKAHFDAYTPNKQANQTFSGYFFISFSDMASRKFLGAGIVAGSSMEEAILNSHSKGINPGGEAIALPIPLMPGNEKYELHMRHLNEFMSMELLRQLGFDIISIPPIEKAITN